MHPIHHELDILLLYVCMCVNNFSLKFEGGGRARGIDVILGNYIFIGIKEYFGNISSLHLTILSV